MARARNIKPSFFQNEDLAEVPPEGQLLFIGMWMLCDRDGKMEWRPKRVRAALFPYTGAEVDVQGLAAELHRRGFIVLYTVNNVDYLKVVNFTKHQHPHQNEKSENLPEPDEANNLFNIGSGATLVKSPSPPVSARPLKESLLRKDDTLKPPSGETMFEEVWKEVWARDPREKKQPKAAALKAYLTVIKKGIPHAEVVEAVKRRLGVDKEGTEYAPHLSTWLNQMRWRDVVAPQTLSPEALAASRKKSEEMSARHAAQMKVEQKKKYEDLTGLDYDTGLPLEGSHAAAN